MTVGGLWQKSQHFVAAIPSIPIIPMKYIFTWEHRPSLLALVEEEWVGQILASGEV